MRKVVMTIAVIGLAGCGRAAEPEAAAVPPTPLVEVAQTTAAVAATVAPTTTVVMSQQPVAPSAEMIVTSMSDPAHLFTGPATIHGDAEPFGVDRVLASTETVVYVEVLSIEPTRLNTRTGGLEATDARRLGLEPPSLTPVTPITVRIVENLGNRVSSDERLDVDTRVGSELTLTLIGGAVRIQTTADRAYAEKLTNYAPDEWVPALKPTDPLVLDFSQSTEVDLHVGDRAVVYVTRRMLTAAQAGVAGPAEPLSVVTPAYDGFAVQPELDGKLAGNYVVVGLPTTLDEARAIARTIADVSEPARPPG